MSDETLDQVANKATEEAPTETISAPKEPVLSPELQELIGEGKKYATVEAALSSIVPAQAHISNLEKQITSQEEIKELIAEAKANQTKGTPTEQAGISPVDTREIVKQELAVERQNAIRQDNLVKVNEAFKAHYGEQSDEAFNKLAAENGMSVASFLKLTGDSPDLILRVAGLNQKTPVGGLKSSINTAALEATKTVPETSAKVEDPSKTEDVLTGWKNAGKKAREKLGIQET
jgi:hypothetical protein